MNRSKSLFERALKTVRINSMLHELSRGSDEPNKVVDHVIVALSGGADSMVLLDFLLWLASNDREYRSLSVHAFHLNHELRENAVYDSQFVKQLCDKLGVQLFSNSVNISEHAKTHKISVEEAGRKVRYSLLSEHASCFLRTHQSCVVATGHNFDDNVETVLLNITRGSGISGLCGISPTRFIRSNKHEKIKIVRPIIDCTRAEIEQHCSVRSLNFVTDESNVDVHYSRNRIRHSVVPQLLLINAGLYNNVGNLMVLAKNDNDYLNKMATDALDDAVALNLAFPTSSFTPCYYSFEKLSDLDYSIFSRAIRIAIERVCELNFIDTVFPSKTQIDLIFESICARKNTEFEINISKEITLKLSQNLLRVIFVFNDYEDVQAETTLANPAHREFSLILNSYTDFSTRKISIKTISLQHFNNQLKNNKVLLKNCCDYGKIHSNCSKPIILRFRKNGDSYRPVNRTGTKRLKKLFSELKIPSELRDNIPLLCDDNGIFWVEHFGCDERVKIDETTQSVLVIELLNL